MNQVAIPAYSLGMVQTVFCDARLPEREIERLREVLTQKFGMKLVLAGGVGSNLVEAAPNSVLREADVAFGQPAVADVIASRKLKLVQLTSAGYARYDSPEVSSALAKRDAVLANASSVYAEPCAEHLLAFMLAGARRLPEAILNQAGKKGWPYAELRARSTLLKGQEVLIVGYGTIARRLIELLAPFGMKISAVRRKVRGDETVRTFPIVAVDELLPSADHVVNILPGTESTAKFFDIWKFARMKRSAVFYNIGRGTTVRQDALLVALHDGLIAGAYLDVTDPEPLPPEDSLWISPNCHITPHTGGGFDLEPAALVNHFLENLDRHVTGTPLLDRIF